MKKTYLICLSFYLIMCVGNIAFADTIPSLFNTGVNDAGEVLSNGEIDPHYFILSGPITGNLYVRTSEGGFPIGPWLGDNSQSAWLCPTTGANNPSGTYIFRTTFDLTGFDKDSAIISGRWSMDDQGVDILINGQSLGITSSGYDRFDDFNIQEGFVDNINSLDFVVEDLLTIGGLRVEMTGTANPVPIPGAIWLLGSGIAGLIGLKCRKNGSKTA